MESFFLTLPFLLTFETTNHKIILINNQNVSNHHLCSQHNHHPIVFIINAVPIDSHQSFHPLQFSDSSSTYKTSTYDIVGTSISKIYNLNKNIRINQSQVWWRYRYNWCIARPAIVALQIHHQTCYTMVSNVYLFNNTTKILTFSNQNIIFSIKSWYQITSKYKTNRNDTNHTTTFSNDIPSSIPIATIL